MSYRYSSTKPFKRNSIESVDTDDHFEDISLIVEPDLLHRVASILDHNMIRRLVTIPGDKVFYEFIVGLPYLTYQLEAWERDPYSILSKRPLLVRTLPF